MGTKGGGSFPKTMFLVNEKGGGISLTFLNVALVYRQGHAKKKIKRMYYKNNEKK